MTRASCTHDLPLGKTEDDLPPAVSEFGWSDAVLVYDPSDPNLEPFYVGAYSHHLLKWNVCGAIREEAYRSCQKWRHLEIPE